jgi:hypothetical protein
MTGFAFYRVVSTLTVLAVLGLPDIRSSASKISSPLTAFWMQVGCGLDPSGSCAPAPGDEPSVEGGDVGCGLDPDGRCLPGNPR